MGSLMHVARSGIVTGRSGTAIAQFIAVIDPLRKSAETLTLPELIEEVLERSRLKDHYAAEKDGQDRLENLNELINAAALFAEDFEHGLEPAGEAQEDVADIGRHARAADPRGLPLAREPGGGRARGGRGPGRAAAHDGALGEGPGVLRGVHVGPRGRALPAREQHARGRRHRGGAPPHVRRHHARAPAPVPLVCRQPHAARPAALRHRVALRRGDPAAAVQVDRAAREAVREPRAGPLAAAAAP